jgi:hypothetical protein
VIEVVSRIECALLARLVYESATTQSVTAGLHPRGSASNQNASRTWGYLFSDSGSGRVASVKHTC